MPPLGKSTRSQKYSGKMDFSSGQTSVKHSRPSENLSTHLKTQTIKKTHLLQTPQIRHIQNESQLKLN